MADTAETLREKVLALFAANVNADPQIAALLEHIHGDGGTGYADADAFALRIGQALADAYKAIQGEIPEHIDAAFADTLLREALRGDYAQVADAAAAVQKALNEQAGLGLNAVRPRISTSRIDGLVSRLAGAEKTQDVFWLLDEPVKNFSMSVVDDTVRANVEFQGKAGLRPRVIRTMHGKSCKWCQGLAGAYDYPDVPKEVYRRHERCRCTVAYDPGRGKRVQDVWSKRWTTAEEHDKIQYRKTVGLQPDSIDGKKRIVIDLHDIEIGKSVGAKAKNENILDLGTGEWYHFVEGTHIQNVQVFAGKGVRTPYRNAEKLSRKYGGKVTNWQHVKGQARIETSDGERLAEVHWSQCEGIGRVDFFVKAWLDES